VSHRPRHLAAHRLLQPAQPGQRALASRLLRLQTTGMSRRPQCRHRDDACCESPGHVRRLHFWNGWTRVMIRSSGQGCGDADLRGQGLMNGATFGDVQ
jgi:hypothetical protein